MKQTTILLRWILLSKCGIGQGAGLPGVHPMLEKLLLEEVDNEEALQAKSEKEYIMN
ncbi:hypothetical protein [Brevibacillus sp. SAFN-007a]|uniref:hypothetical protein n=1 Tax=Brevibacillus sp. SAFN-007a TaxID=3436862 RepID=UPI003F7E8480